MYTHTIENIAETLWIGEILENLETFVFLHPSHPSSKPFPTQDFARNAEIRDRLEATRIYVTAPKLKLRGRESICDGNKKKLK